MAALGCARRLGELSLLDLLPEDLVKEPKPLGILGLQANVDPEIVERPLIIGFYHIGDRDVHFSQFDECSLLVKRDVFFGELHKGLANAFGLEEGLGVFLLFLGPFREPNVDWDPHEVGQLAPPVFDVTVGKRHLFADEDDLPLEIFHPLLLTQLAPVGGFEARLLEAVVVVVIVGVAGVVVHFGSPSIR